MRDKFKERGLIMLGKILNELFKKDKHPFPEVGIKLVDPIWGGDYIKIEVAKVSKCKTCFFYRFLTVDWKTCSDSRLYEYKDWKVFTKKYRVVEEGNEK